MTDIEKRYKKMLDFYEVARAYVELLEYSTDGYYRVFETEACATYENLVEEIEEMFK